MKMAKKVKNRRKTIDNTRTRESISPKIGRAKVITEIIINISLRGLKIRAMVEPVKSKVTRLIRKSMQQRTQKKNKVSLTLLRRPRSKIQIITSEIFYLMINDAH